MKHFALPGNGRPSCQDDVKSQSWPVTSEVLEVGCYSCLRTAIYVRTCRAQWQEAEALAAVLKAHAETPRTNDGFGMGAWARPLEEARSVYAGRATLSA